ncbi:uncharacterized protein HKW66_Vig0032700 [Vigna angularis]|uniref:Uncharacterized protein n=1 Tax=Phaseolus angularis TaxID=3914 RepID=A0A8T0LCD8_PHAAN|nr:uncharacterized protein HKW66_Vig0032700 [Vigna angularis]
MEKTNYAEEEDEENRNPPRTLSSPRRPRPRRQLPLRRQASFQTKPPPRQHDLERLGDGDLERWRQAATTEGSPIWSGLTTAIWSGGSREAEAAAADAGLADLERLGDGDLELWI